MRLTDDMRRAVQDQALGYVATVRREWHTGAVPNRHNERPGTTSSWSSSMCALRTRSPICDVIHM